MINILAVGAGGFLGAVLRYGGSTAFVSRLGLHKAFATFFRNIIGCLIIRFLGGF